MTLGVTGVVWISRPAVVNSARLTLGAGPAPLAAASAAWTSIAATLDGIAMGLTHVMAELSAGWQGDAATAAQSTLGPFLAWTSESSACAARVATKAMAQSTAYTTALAIMPSAPEIAAVTAAKATAYSTGGAVNGTAAAAEAADTAMNVRAALVMESYEATTSVLAIPDRFNMPPPIAHTLPGSVDLVRNAAAYADSEASNFSGGGSSTVAATAHAIQAQSGNASSSAASALNNPAVSASVNHVAGAVGSGAGSAASNLGSAGSNLGSGASHLGASSMGSGSDRTHTVAAGILGISGLSGMLGKSDLSALASSSVGGVEEKKATAAERGLQNAESGRTGGGVPSGQARPDEDDEHDTPEYLKQFEHFEDGRTVAPSVIGADPDWAEQ